MDIENSGSSDVGTSSASDLSSAIQSVSTEAPKLTGLDKLKADKAHVDKTGEIPGKTAVPAASAAPGAPTTPVAVKTAPIDPNAPVKPFTPDFKYKAGGKEAEIPEKFRALCTDEASLEEVKKLFGQAATLDEVKANNATLKDNIGKVGAELNKFNTGVQVLRGLSAKGDWDTFFNKMNIPAEKIYQWVLDKVTYNQLPPEQKAQLDQQRNLQRQAETAQENLGQASHREMQLATQVKGMQLDATLGRADVKSMSDAFDSRVGKPGAFKEAIIEHGKAMWALSNSTVDLSPDQAVADFVQKYGNPSAFGSPTPAAGAAIPASTTPTGANAQPPVKVIPNVNGRNSASPIKQKPKNLEDLKRLRDEAVKADNATRTPSQGYLAG